MAGRIVAVDAANGLERWTMEINKCVPGPLVLYSHAQSAASTRDRSVRRWPAKIVASQSDRPLKSVLGFTSRAARFLPIVIQEARARELCRASRSPFSGLGAALLLLSAWIGVGHN